MIQKCMSLYLIKVERYNATHIMIHNPNYIELKFTVWYEQFPNLRHPYLWVLWVNIGYDKNSSNLRHPYLWCFGLLKGMIWKNPKPETPIVSWVDIVYDMKNSSTWYTHTGLFLPISRVQISAPFPIENSHLYSLYHVWFSQLKKKEKKIVLLFLETTTTYDPYQNDT